MPTTIPGKDLQLPLVNNILDADQWGGQSNANFVAINANEQFEQTILALSDRVDLLNFG